jgi:hypothetical protein
MEEPIICQWCHTEIVWDEELGPEAFCPHCDNELDGYRTISFSVDNDSDAEEEPMDQDESDTDEASGISQLDPDGYRHTNPGMLALEEKMEAILDLQEEVPECPVCREYMLELGKQTVAAEGWQSTVHEPLGHPLLQAPFRMVWYVCPSCYHMQNRLSADDREALLDRLSIE